MMTIGGAFRSLLCRDFLVDAPKGVGVLSWTIRARLGRSKILQLSIRQSIPRSPRTLRRTRYTKQHN